jgi:hypothetical protein
MVADRPIFVHCAANRRVSNVIFLYRVKRQGISETTTARATCTPPGNPTPSGLSLSANN